MTVQHHPGDDLLLSYAAGALAESWSLAIAAHLAHCPQCRANIFRAEEVGGVLLSEIDPVAMLPNSLDQVFEAIHETPEKHVSELAGPAKSEESAVASFLPKSLQDYVGKDIDNLPWQRLGTDGHQFLVDTNDQSAQARLLRIKAGRPVPSHGHNGRELTLVLAGAFEDETSRFSVGDLQDVDQETIHKPIAGSGEDCICLAVTDAPLRFKEFLPRLFQPVFKI